MVYHKVCAVDFFFYLCCALANSFLENMSFTVLAGDHVAEVLGAPLKLGCSVVGCETTVIARKRLFFKLSFGN